MKRLQTLQQTYQIREDVRVEPVRLGKYIYLALLLTLLTIVVHTLFGHLYLLQGEGFVYAANEEIAFEFDATITDLAVSEGTVVQSGDLLLRYESIELQQKLVDLVLQLSRLHKELNDAKISLTRVDINLAAANEYAAFANELEKVLRNLKTKGIVTSPQLGPEIKRRFEAIQSLSSYKAEKQQIENGIQVLTEDIRRVELHYRKLLQAFGDGEIRAPRRGVITNLKITKGSVLREGTPAMRLFELDRYILCYFDERSLVPYRAGDPVLVSTPSHGLKLGRIQELTLVSNPLPEEFQPRFKPQERQQLALIEVDPGLLRDATMLSTVSVSKLPLMHLVLKIRSLF